MNVLIDPSTGPLPWEILRVDINRSPIRFRGQIAGVGLSSIELIVCGVVHPEKHRRPRALRLMPGDIACVIESVSLPRTDGTRVVTLREYRKPYMSLRKTSLRIRYRQISPGRFAVHENRGDVLGHVTRSAKGYAIEGTHHTAKSMREILANFRREKPADVAQRLSDQFRSDMLLQGIITRDEARTCLGLPVIK